jgi:hypothetical protein
MDHDSHQWRGERWGNVENLEDDERGWKAQLRRGWTGRNLKHPSPRVQPSCTHVWSVGEAILYKQNDKTVGKAGCEEELGKTRFHRNRRPNLKFGSIGTEEIPKPPFDCWGEMRWEDDRLDWNVSQPLPRRRKLFKVQTSDTASLKPVGWLVMSDTGRQHGTSIHSIIFGSFCSFLFSLQCPRSIALAAVIDTPEAFVAFCQPFYLIFYVEIKTLDSQCFIL